MVWKKGSENFVLPLTLSFWLVGAGLSSLPVSSVNLKSHWRNCYNSLRVLKDKLWRECMKNNVSFDSEIIEWSPAWLSYLGSPLYSACESEWVKRTTVRVKWTVQSDLSVLSIRPKRFLFSLWSFREKKTKEIEVNLKKMMRQPSSEWGRVGLGFLVTWGLIYKMIMWLVLMNGFDLA